MKHDHNSSLKAGFSTPKKSEFTTFGDRITKTGPKKFSQKLLIEISAFVKPQDLEAISLAGYNFGIYAQDLAKILATKPIKELDLHNCSWKKENTPQKKLSLYSVGSQRKDSDKDLAALVVQSEISQTLAALDLEVFNPSNNFNSFIHHLSRSKTIEMLDLSCNNFEKKHYEQAAADLASLPTLTRLNLGKTFLADSAPVVAEKLAASKTLRELDLTMTKLESHSIDTAKSLSKSPSLSKLILAFNNLREHALQLVEILLTLPSLSYLDLRQNNISIENAEKIKTVVAEHNGKLPKLKAFPDAARSSETTSTLERDELDLVGNDGFRTEIELLI